MPQKHRAQLGLFHVVTNTNGKIPWCTFPGIPEIIIKHLLLTKNHNEAFISAFCLLPTHIHLLLNPGEPGLSKFMHAFKKNSSREAAAVCEPLLREQIGWQKGYYDQIIRTDRQKSSAWYYVTGNARHHGFVTESKDWPWSSLYFEDELYTE